LWENDETPLYVWVTFTGINECSLQGFDPFDNGTPIKLTASGVCIWGADYLYNGDTYHIDYGFGVGTTFCTIDIAADYWFYFFQAPACELSGDNEQFTGGDFDCGDPNVAGINGSFLVSWPGSP